MQEHCENRETYLEFLKGSCEREKGVRCEHRHSHEFCCYTDIKYVPRLYPTTVRRPGLHYLAAKDTPTVGRSVDDFHP